MAAYYGQNMKFPSDMTCSSARFSSFPSCRNFSFLCEIFPLSLKNHVDRENAARSDQRLPETLVRSIRNFFHWKIRRLLAQIFEKAGKVSGAPAKRINLALFDNAFPKTADKMVDQA